MKKFLFSLLFFALVIPIMPEETTQSKISGEDREKLKRINAQMQLLNLQAQILNEERARVFERNCAAAKLAIDGCYIDPETGLISKLQAAK